MKKIYKNMSALCILPNGKLVCYKCGYIYILEKYKIEKRFLLFKGEKERMLGSLKYLSRLFRLGIRAAESIDDENIIVSIGNMIYEINIINETISEGYYCGDGIRPLKFSTVKGITNIKEGIYFGGYLSNPTKKSVGVYRRISTDKWELVYLFPCGLINHVHAIISDVYRDCLWIFTGDFGESSAIWKVKSNFDDIERVAYNNQKYRGCVVFAIPEGLLYATDAPFENNNIYLMNCDNYEVKDIKSIDGSCIYGCQWKNYYIFSSTVEGDGRNTSLFSFLLGRKRGAGIKNDYVHLYMGNLLMEFKEIYKEKKDFLPLYTFQFGVFKFPSGINNSEVLYFQPVATILHDLDLMSITEYEIKHII